MIARGPNHQGKGIYGPLPIRFWDDAAWERAWAPYDETTYQSVLESIHWEDIVLEIGAGDLRLARQIAKKAKKVYAIENQPRLVTLSPSIGNEEIQACPDFFQQKRQSLFCNDNHDLGRDCLIEPQAVLNQPDNLTVICGDARQIPFPNGISTGILLMRHCTSFSLYYQKLVKVGCQRFITNARWGIGVEVIDLAAPRYPYKDVEIGWYACHCGHTNFVPGRPEHLTTEVMDTIHEVKDCPWCNEEDNKRSLEL